MIYILVSLKDWEVTQLKVKNDDEASDFCDYNF